MTINVLQLARQAGMEEVCTDNLFYAGKADLERFAALVGAEHRGALLWVLWHHQGGNSPVGQPIRTVLGIGRFDRLTDDQVADAKRWDKQQSATQRFASSMPRTGPEVDTRACTCHPADHPPKPCPRKFALSECIAAAGVKGGGDGPAL